MTSIRGWIKGRIRSRTQNARSAARPGTPAGPAGRGDRAGPVRSGGSARRQVPAWLTAPVWALLILGCAGGSYRAERTTPSLGYRNGVWEGSGRGHGGEIRVEVRIASGLIQEIGIAPHQEDPFTGGEAMAELLELVLDYQSTDLDAISGATESSAGFLAAVEEALGQAARREPSGP
ncbi:MAG: FMN-binding protein, partial [Treponema sp.]|nr:FMN-binding protein [Treponema sp.]